MYHFYALHNFSPWGPLLASTHRRSTTFVNIWISSSEELSLPGLILFGEQFCRRLKVWKMYCYSILKAHLALWSVLHVTSKHYQPWVTDDVWYMEWHEIEAILDFWSTLNFDKGPSIEYSCTVQLVCNLKEDQFLICCHLVLRMYRVGCYF